MTPLVNWSPNNFELTTRYHQRGQLTTELTIIVIIGHLRCRSTIRVSLETTTRHEFELIRATNARQLEGERSDRRLGGGRLVEEGEGLLRAPRLATTHEKKGRPISASDDNDDDADGGQSGATTRGVERCACARAFDAPSSTQIALKRRVAARLWHFCRRARRLGLARLGSACLVSVSLR